MQFYRLSVAQSHNSFHFFVFVSVWLPFYFSQAYSTWQPACLRNMSACVFTCGLPHPQLPKHLASNAVHFIPEMSETAVVPQGSRVQLSVQEAVCLFRATADLDV